MKKSLKYIKSFAIFVAISAISILGVMFFYHGGLDFSRLTLSSILIASLISISSLYVEAERVRFIGRSSGTKIPFKAAIENVMGREFLSAITPFGSGGQPLGVYIMNKYGIKLGQAITISYLETFYTMLMLFVGGTVCLVFYHELLASNVLKGFLIWSFGAMIYFFFVSYFSISKPKIIKKIGFYLVNFLHKIRIVKGHRLFHLKGQIVKEVRLFHEHIRKSFRSHWVLILGNFFSTLLFWCLRFVSVYAVVVALGYEISLIDLVAYQMIITSVNYFSFTPGGSGTTDWLGAVLFGTFIVEKDMATFVTLWRFFSYHLIIIICGIVIFKVIRLFSQQKKAREAQNQS